MKIIFCLFIVATLLCGCDSLLLPPSQSSANVVNGTYSLTPRKVDFQAIAATNFFNVIPWDNLKQTEFETTVQYSNRLDSVQTNNQPVFVEIATGKHIYSPEKQMLYFGITPDYGQPDLFTVNYSSKEYDRDVEQNAYGAKVEVKHIRADSLKFRYLNLSQVSAQVLPYIENADSTGQNVNCLGFLIPMSSDVAKEVVDSNSLYLVARVKIKNLQNAKNEMSADGATIDSPTSYLFVNYELPVEISGLALVNRSSGTILASWSAETNTVTW